MDVRDACLSYETERTRIFIGDQSDPAFWAKFRAEVPDLDIVVDDGGHRAPEQIATLEGLLPHMRPGGVFVCEDVHGRYNPFVDYVYGLSHELHAYRAGTRPAEGLEPKSFQRAIDSVHLYPFLVVIEKRATQLDRFVCPQPRHGVAASRILGGQAGPILELRHRSPSPTPSPSDSWMGAYDESDSNCPVADRT